LNIHKVCL